MIYTATTIVVTCPGVMAAIPNQSYLKSLELFTLFSTFGVSFVTRHSYGNAVHVGHK